VEENALVRSLVEQQLRSFGLRSGGAPDAQTALQLLRDSASAPFDFVLNRLPLGAAAALAREIKAAYASLPVLLLAPEGGEMDVCLRPPLGRAETLECLGSFLKPPSSTEGKPQATEETVAAALPRGLKVLVVEDNLVNQMIALALLKKWDCAAEVVEDGETALEAVRETAYDVLLMDRELPGCDGCETVRRIRDYERIAGRAPAWIVAMTAHVEEAARQECREAGMDAFLSKPVLESALKEAIMRRIG